MMITAMLQRCAVIEECYEAMLAYAAKGYPPARGEGTGSSIRQCLRRALLTLDGLPERCALAVSEGRLEPPERYLAFVSVLEHDARDSLAALELILAQPSIGSQMVDNLNASIHLRAMPTDLFLLGDILRSRTTTTVTRRALPHPEPC